MILKMRRSFLILVSVFISFYNVVCQVNENQAQRILFRGIVSDASTLSPVPNTQILINNTFSAISAEDGTFSLYVTRSDTIHFRNLGYKESVIHLDDTLTGQEFIAGIYLSGDTISIGEVVIMPGISNLRSEIMNARSPAPATFENARYNVAVSAYQGRISHGSLGNPDDNYRVISQKQKIDAYEKGGIPSDKIVGFSPLLFLPAAFLLVHGPEPSPLPMKARLSEQEVEKIHRRYLESVSVKK